MVCCMKWEIDSEAGGDNGIYFAMIFCFFISTLKFVMPATKLRRSEASASPRREAGTQLWTGRLVAKLGPCLRRGDGERGVLVWKTLVFAAVQQVFNCGGLGFGQSGKAQWWLADFRQGQIGKN